MDFSLIKFNTDGLVPVVAQDAVGKMVLMLAYADREALDATEKTGFAHFHSRSRGKLWKKGESSGNTLAVTEIRLDCDGDSLLYLCNPAGPTCHTGVVSCFFKKVHGAPAGGGDAQAGSEILSEIENVLQERTRSSDKGSYTARLLQGDRSRIRSKVSEEAFETVLASERNDNNLADEIADLWFHTMLLLVSHGLRIESVFAALEKRKGKRRE